MALTKKADYAFKHASQIDEPAFATTALLKTALDSQAVEIRTYLNDTLTVESEALFATKAEVAAVVTGDIPDGSLTLAKLDTDVATQAELNTHKTSTDHDSRYYTETEVNTLIDSLNYNVGKVEYFAMSTAPTGYLKANGAAVSRVTYSKLFTAIGTTFGVGDGSTTFNLPDGRGLVPRGWDDGRGYDTGRSFGSYQADGNKSHGHTGTTNSDGSHTHTYNQGNTSDAGGGGSGTALRNIVSTTTSTSGSHTHSFTTNTDGNTEATVKNIAWLCCIKY